VGPPAPLSAAGLKAAECRRLDEQVGVLDAYARQPLSGGEQDRVARQRRDLRDLQFRLRCGR
jgi:predicted ABC-type transport system involved in lysophospholipase L1 biosynthesis ATPase subunit